MHSIAENRAIVAPPSFGTIIDNISGAVKEQGDLTHGVLT